MDWLIIIGVPGAFLASLGIIKFFIEKNDAKNQKLIAKPIYSISPEHITTELKFNGNKFKYKGYKVQWSVVFDKLGKSIFGGGQLILKDGNVQLRTKVSLNKYPQLKNEEKGKNNIVTGIVKKAENQTIHLKLIDLKSKTLYVI